MAHDPLFDALRALPEHSPDTRRGARVRATCRRRIQCRAQHRQIATRMLQGATAAAVCAYLASVISAALRVVISVQAW